MRPLEFQLASLFGGICFYCNLGKMKLSHFLFNGLWWFLIFLLSAHIFTPKLEFSPILVIIFPKNWVGSTPKSIEGYLDIHSVHGFNHADGGENSVEVAKYPSSCNHGSVKNCMYLQ